MEYQEFIKRIVGDLELEYEKVRLQGDNNLYITANGNDVEVPLNIMWEQSNSLGYSENLKQYKGIISDILTLTKHDLSLANVYPIIKKRKDIYFDYFVREDLFLDLDLLYVSDMGEVFRFVSINDLIESGIDVNTLRKRSFKNLNKLKNILFQLDKDYEIYTVKYESDYGATLFLNKNMQMQIRAKCGDDILFCIPSSSVLICAPYNQASCKTYAKILRELMKVDKDINKISNLVYRRDSKGIYSVID